MSSTRTGNSLKNMGASVIYQALNIVLSFVSRTIFIQILGVGYLGISGLFNDILSMLNLAELGFGTVMTFSMYKPLADKDYDTLAGLTHYYKIIYRTIAAIIAGVGLLGISFLPYLINLEQEIPHLEIYYVLFLMSNVASYLVTYKTTILYADQKNYILIKYTAFWSVAQTIILTLVLFLTHNYILYLIIQVLFVYCANIHKSHIASNYYPFINKNVKLNRTTKKNIVKDVGSAFIYKVANVLINATDNTLISILVSTEMVGYYSNYNIVVAKIGGIVNTIFYSLIASLGNLIAKETAERRYSVFQIMQSLSSILGTFCITCIFLLEENLIKIWLGTEYMLGLIPMISIALNFYFSIVLAPIAAFKEAAGLFRKTKFILIWRAIINLVLSIVLGKLIGLPGILFATSLSAIVTNYWYEPFVLFKEFFLKPSSLYYKEIFKNIGITLLSIGAGFITLGWFEPNNFFELIIKGFFIAIESITIICVFYRKTDGFIMLKEKIEMLFKSVFKAK